MKPGNSKISRRAFGRMVAATGLAAGASPVPSQTPSREEELRAANERRLVNAQALARFDLPMAGEPSFVFRPL